MTESITTDLPWIDRESLIKECLPLNGARVIDIGCGEGWLTQLVAAEVGTGSVIGIDPSAAALKRARAAKKTGNTQYLLAGADDLPLESACCDIAIYFNSLHHVPANLQKQAFAETARALANGGLLCIVEPVSSGSAYELFRPVDDESDVYGATHDFILDAAGGVEFQALLEELFVDGYTYRDFEQFLDYLLAVDGARSTVLAERQEMLRELFERLGEAVDGGRRYDQVHRLNLLRKVS